MLFVTVGFANLPVYIVGARVLSSSGVNTDVAEDDALIIHSSAQPPRAQQYHLCRAIRQDNMSRLNLQGTVNIQDGDFLIEEFEMPSQFVAEAHKHITLQATRTKPYVFAWSL